MGDVVDIEPYLRKCENCKWYVPLKPLGSRCGKPGGWHMNMTTMQCADFVRKSIIGRDPLCGPLQL